MSVTYFEEKKLMLNYQRKNFLRFHESTNIVLAPKGVKRVGIALSVNEQDGRSVIIT